jgi:hypothetical protein
LLPESLSSELRVLRRVQDGMENTNRDIDDHL